VNCFAFSGRGTACSPITNEATGSSDLMMITSKEEKTQQIQDLRRPRFCADFSCIAQNFNEFHMIFSWIGFSSVLLHCSSFSVVFFQDFLCTSGFRPGVLYFLLHVFCTVTVLLCRRILRSSFDNRKNKRKWRVMVKSQHPSDFGETG
jgi:hypothetical protein